MSEPPDKLRYNNHDYHHPTVRFTVEELEEWFSHCGTLRGHTCCLRCGREEDEEHRLNWLSGCDNDCLLCGLGKRSTVKHFGKPCPRMQMTYAEYFTPEFFALHAGVPLQPWDPKFEALYVALRDNFSRTTGASGERGRPHLQEERSSRFTRKSNVRTSEKDKEEDRPSRSRPSFKDRDAALERLQAKFDELDKRTRYRSRSPSRSPRRSPRRGLRRSRSPRRSASPAYRNRTKLICHVCGDEGHKARNCPKKDQCLLCREYGHIARNCPTKDTCMNCGCEGHWAKDCPDRGKCFKCHKRGHHSDKCPKEKTARFSPPPETRRGTAQANTSHPSASGSRSLGIPERAREALKKRKSEPIDIDSVVGNTQAPIDYAEVARRAQEELKALQEQMRMTEQRYRELTQARLGAENARLAAEKRSRRLAKELKMARAGNADDLVSARASTSEDVGHAAASEEEVPIKLESSEETREPEKIKQEERSISADDTMRWEDVN